MTNDNDATVETVEPDVYVFIDASNIRSCCLKSCDFKIDFLKLIEYLKKKYKNLKQVNYYEGIANNDKNKKKRFEKLSSAGYRICTLSRKKYVSQPVLKEFNCENCGYKNSVQVTPKVQQLKSNVDVFLASEVLDVACKASEKTHIILWSCDGDYAEMIKIALKNENIRVTVWATPFIKDDIGKNTLSTRLKDLRRELPDGYSLNSVTDIRDYIAEKESGSEDTLSRVGNASPVLLL